MEYTIDSRLDGIDFIKDYKFTWCNISIYFDPADGEGSVPSVKFRVPIELDKDEDINAAETKAKKLIKSLMPQITNIFECY